MGPLASAAEVELFRQMVANPTRFERPAVAAAASDAPTLSPETALLLGSLADAGSTYAFLKAPGGREDNALIGFTRSHPEATALAALGGTAAALGIRKLLAKKWPRVANTLAGGLGGYQMALAASNLNLTSGRGPNDSARDAMQVLGDAIRRVE